MYNLWGNKISLLTILFYIYIVFLSLIFLFLVGINFRKNKHEHKWNKNYNPKVLVIVPCKGKDITLYDNLLSLKKQNYKNYDLIAVVADKKDYAVKEIKKAGIKFIIAEKSDKGSAKVRSLYTALKNYKYDAYVFADSDITAKSNWLKNLIAPLSDKKIGLSTSFPYFNPVAGFWSDVKMMWGFVGQGMMESEITRFGWGGSLAFRRDILDKESLEYFRNSISDDIAITRIVKAKDLGMAYSKKSQPVVNSDDNFSSFWEWSTRQTAFTISASRRTYYYGVAFYFANILLFISAIALSFYSLIFLIFLIPFGIGIVKNLSRVKKMSLIVFPVAFMMNFIYLVNLLLAGRMKEVRWRGITYSLESVKNIHFKSEL